MDLEIKKVRNQFLNVGYPKWVIDQKIKTTLTKLLSPDDPFTPEIVSKKEREKPEFWMVLHLPWSGEKADKTAKTIKKTITQEEYKKSLAYKITKVRDKLLKYRSPDSDLTKFENTLLTSDCVYMYSCGCGSKYIGETKRLVGVRGKEHGKDDRAMIKMVQIFDNILTSVKNRSNVKSIYQNRLWQFFLTDSYRNISYKNIIF